MKIQNKNELILISIVSFIVFIIITFLVAIIIIWNPVKKNKDITAYTYTDFESEIVKYYQSRLENILKKSNVNILIDKLDEEYLDSINLKKEDKNGIIDYLNNKHLLTPNPAILDYTVSKNDDTGLYVYNFTFKTNGFKRKVYLLETEPYVYTISFEQKNSPTSAKKYINKIVDGIKFEITLEESTNESLRYNAKITNEGTVPVKFNFNDISSVELNLKDGRMLKLGSVVAMAEENYIINTNSYMNRELFFNVPLEQQGSINSITIYNVLIGDNEKVITIEF